MSSPESSPGTSTLETRLQRVLGGTYEIERELGGGGMSRVFLAMERSLERRVVVKVLRDDVLEGVSRERFRREVLLSANLQHPNIVGVIAAAEAEGQPWFVMPYVEGESLRARMRREGSLSVPNAVAIMRDVARALSFAHGRGVVHRDIKPDNVLLAGGAAMVADFGVAKALASARESERHPRGTLTGAGISLGTPAYMSPEQVSGDPDVDHRADIYAFGVTAYEMLAGQPPFVRRSVAEQLTAHLVDAPPPVSSVRPGVPSALATLIARCLEKVPGDRPQSAEELLTLLDDPAMVSGEVFSAPTPSMLLARRRRGRRWALAGVAGLVVAIAAVTWALQRSAPTANQPAAAGTLPAGTIGLAVFPLFSVAADTTSAVLADGMTDALTNAFAGLPGVRVVSRSALQAVLRDSAGFSIAAQKLGVPYYLEGAVQRASGRIRVSVRLVDARDDLTLWSDVHESSDDDVLAAQSEVANAIVSAFASGELVMRAGRSSPPA